MKELAAEYPIIHISNTSYLYFEMQIMIHNPFSVKNPNNKGPKKRNPNEKVIKKRRRNLLEVINLHRVDEDGKTMTADGKEHANGKWINLSDVYAMSLFLYFKLKNSNTFSISVAMKDDRSENFSVKNSTK